MAGNVWEFVDEPGHPNARSLKDFESLSPPPTAAEPWHTMRGGSYDFQFVDNVTTEYMRIPARYADDSVGFRCVKDVQ